jgi:hypothetical protein
MFIVNVKLVLVSILSVFYANSETNALVVCACACVQARVLGGGGGV